MTESLKIAGVNHRKATVEIRERLAVPKEKISDALAAFRGCTGADETLILSTCNRVEVYFAGGEPDAVSALGKFIASWHRIRAEEIGECFYGYDGIDAARHLFRVVSGLDSMVVGETQILNQVKDAYLAAEHCRSTGRVLNQVFQKALSVGKLVHSRTTIHETNASVPGVAAKLAERIFADVAEKEVLVVGAGEMGELALEELRHRGAKRIVVCNRTLESAERLALRAGGRAAPLTSIEESLSKADIVVACVGGESFVVTGEMARRAATKRRNAPMFLVDLGVPRNIDPDAGSVENVYLFDIDDLQEIVDKNSIERDRAVEECRKLIDAELEKFSRQFVRTDIAETLSAVRNRFHSVGDDEIPKTLEKLPSLGEREREEVAYLVRRVLNKILHDPMTAIREIKGREDEERVAEIIRKIFRL